LVTAGLGLATVLAWPFLFDVRPWPAAARFWISAATYFDGGCTMAFEAARAPDDNSEPEMTCYHPHGIFTLGLILNSGVRSSAAEHRCGSAAWARYCGAVGPFPCVGLAASKLVRMPVFRHIMVKWTGNIECASRAHMLWKMQRKDSFGLCPGGFHELALFKRGSERVYARKRGFIAYALKHGYRVTPAYTFGESATFFNVPGWERAREALADRGVPAILVSGPLWWLPVLGLIPFGRGGLHTIHGEGRQFPQIDNPTAAQVEEYHGWYVGALRALYDRHKARFGLEGSELEVFS